MRYIQEDISKSLTRMFLFLSLLHATLRLLAPPVSGTCSLTSTFFFLFCFRTSAQICPFPVPTLSPR